MLLSVALKPWWRTNVKVGNLTNDSRIKTQQKSHLSCLLCESKNCAYFIACTCISEKIWLSLNIIESLLKIASFSIIIFILNFHTSCTLHHISVFNMQLYKDVHGCTPSYAKSSAPKVHYVFFISFSNHSSSLGFIRCSKGLLCIHWFDWIIELAYLQIEKKD